MENRYTQIRTIRWGSIVPKRTRKPTRDGPPYKPPKKLHLTSVAKLLDGVREIPKNQEGRLGISKEMIGGLRLWCSGDLSLIRKPCVAIVGARKVSDVGAKRARRLARELVKAGVVVVSGLAYGVDTEALTAAVNAGGKTIAVIGTPINKAYPAANNRLQEKIYREHLLISQFEPNGRVFRSNFPDRNKMMAAISDATVIIEASDTSGSLHQAAECVRLNRWLFIAKSLLDDPNLKWPSDFMRYPNTKPLRSTQDVLEVLGISRGCHSK